MTLPASPVVLAYVGDAVFELAVRERLASRGPEKVAQLHREAVSLVRAPAQAEFLRRLEPHLTAEEADLVRWARNAKSGAAPRGVPAQEYRHATAFEALLGHLYLTGRRERLEQLLALLWGQAGLGREGQK